MSTSITAKVCILFVELQSKSVATGPEASSSGWPGYGLKGPQVNLSCWDSPLSKSSPDDSEGLWVNKY